MTDKQLNHKINQAFSKVTPDCLDSVLKDCKEEKGEMIAMTNQTNRRQWGKLIAVAASIVLLITGVGFYGNYHLNHTAVSTVSLDVNPAIEMKLNKKERVLNVIPLNEDGEKIIGDMDFKNSDLDVAVNALVGSMLKNGYLSDISNSILVSVDGADAQKSAAIQQELSAEIDSFMKSQGMDVAIVSQIVDNHAAETIAEKFGLSLGKAQFIEKLVAANPRYTVEALAGMTFNELNVLAQTSKMDMTDMNSTGKASQKAYIGQDRAEAIALAHAGIARADVLKLKSDLETEQGMMVYDVDFNTRNMEYEVLVNAETGGIVSMTSEKDYLDQDDVVPEGNYIGKEAAKNIALNYAGLKESEVKNLICKRDNDDGVICYEVEFDSKTTEYKIVVDAKTGKILEAETDKIDNDIIVKPSTSQISEKDAKSIALNYAGLKESEVKNLTCKRDDDDGVICYEVEFDSKTTEYKIVVDAKTGKILEAETDKIDNDIIVKPSTSQISEKDAKSIALNYAGLKESEVKNLTCKRDDDDGVICYEVKFDSKTTEYDIVVDAKTGKILEVETEKIDDASSSASNIGKQSAINAAVNHAGLRASEVKHVKCELDDDDGMLVYEVEFTSGRYEYSYTIDALKGAVLEYEKEIDD